MSEMRRQMVAVRDDASGDARYFRGDPFVLVNESVDEAEVEVRADRSLDGEQDGPAFWADAADFTVAD